MPSVDVDVITNNGLTRHVYSFTCVGTTLNYTGYGKYERSTIHNLWADEWGEPKSFVEWCSDKKIDESIFDEYDERGWSDEMEQYYTPYENYCSSFNGCMVKTIDRRSCYLGAGGYGLNKSYPLPDGVKELAKKKFIKLLKVEE